jgi:hypothetical protein
MSLQGRWRIIEMPGYEADYPDMMEPAYILFGPTRGEFASDASPDRSPAPAKATP